MKNDAPAANPKLITLYLIIAFLSLVILFGLGYLLFWGKGESVQVQSFLPKGEVPQTTNFTVTFSREVAPDSLVNQWISGQPISFSPSIPGKFQWIGREKLRFYPDVPLQPSTEYTAEVTSRAISGFGFSLRGQRSFQFYSPRFQVNSASLNFETLAQAEKKANLLATVEFNYPVNPAEAAASITIRYKGGAAIPFRLLTANPGTVLELKAEQIARGPDEGQIELMIARGLKPVGGNLGLEQDFLKPVTLPREEDLKVEKMSPIRETPKSGYVRVEFNLPVAATTAAAFISIEPALKYKISATHQYLELKGDFQMETTYQIVVRKGLKAIDGSQLKRDFSAAVVFRTENIPPQVNFVGDGFYLTKSGHLNIGLATINIEKVHLEVDKIYANNLIYLLNSNDLAGSEGYYWYDLEALGKRIHEHDLVIQNVTNEEVVTPLNIQKYLADERVGIFNITAREYDRRWNQASKWVLATDLGIVAKKGGNGLWVWVNSLTKLSPIVGAEISLYSQNNQLLATAKTNNDGMAVFESFQTLTEQFVPFLVTAAAGNDFSFLELTRRQIATSDFDVAGASYLEHGYNAFLYSERGVYRPGETVHLASIIRGENLTVPSPFPIMLRVKGPDEKIVEEQKATFDEQGSAAFTLTIPEYAKTGKYLSQLLVGENEEIGRVNFNVEEFVPDRMKVRLTTSRAAYRAGEAVKMTVEAITFFGPPATGRRVQADVELEAVPFAPAKWKSFSFQDDKKSFARVRTDLGEEILDDQGRIEYVYDIPDDLEAPSAVRAMLSATVLEPGGRGVTDYRGIMIHPHPAYVGLRMAKEGYAAPHQATPIEMIVVDTAGTPLANRKIEVTLNHIYWQSILKKVDQQGHYRYVSEEVEREVDRFSITSAAVNSTFQVTPDDYGRYRVVAKDVATGASAAVSFYASGWGYAPWAMDHPERIEMDLDKTAYLPGEKARLQIRAPFPGKLLLTIEREKVFNYKIVTLRENTATIELPILSGYQPNVYAVAHLIRSTESLERDTPVRAFGVIPLPINNDPNRLGITLAAPAEIRPQSKLTINFKISGATRGQPMVTIAAVDEGILQLTDFSTPDAHAYFFGRKRLSTETNDMYGVVLPEIAMKQSSSAGDVEAARRRHLIPVSITRTRPVAFWSGLIKGAQGKVSFDVPQFNGTLRLMVVAWNQDRFGNSEQQLFVREPIVMTPTFPRFIATGDQFTIPVSVYNGTGSDNSFEIKLQVKGPARILDRATQTVTINAAREEAVYFPIQAEQSMGVVEFHLMASGAREKTSMNVEIPLRPPVPFITLAGSGSVAPGKPATFVFPANWLEGTVRFSLSLSAFPAVKFASSLQYLLSYPHGCIEQTTSKLFPLLYFDDLARIAEPELFKKNSADYYIEEGIAKIASLQLPSGAFSYWPEGDYINNWSSIYAAHFLVEARKAGYTVPDRVYDRMIDALRSQSREYRGDDAYSFQTAVYACYVLSLAGKPEKSTMLYFKNNALSRLSDFSMYQLAGALALSGDQPSARALLPKTVLPLTDGPRETGQNFNSPIRSQAIMLDILAEIDPSHPSVPTLVQNLTAAAGDNGRWYSTQENAFAFLALGKISKKQSAGNYSGHVVIDGQKYQTFDTQNRTFAASDWAGKQVTIDISGTGTCYYAWRADGLPASLRIDEFDHDLLVRRHYLNEQGIPIANATFKPGDLVIAKITVKALTSAIDNVAIIDMLPAGFEIENPRLQSRKGIDWIGEETAEPMYMDIRDDRIILYGNFEFNRQETFYYGLRAVTVGSFILPPIRAEAMYAPMKASVASSGQITVK